MKMAWLVSMVAVAALAGERVAYGQAAGFCRIQTTPLSFGSYNVFATADLASTATITFTCYRRGPAALTVTVDLGKGSVAATNSPRQMSNGVDRLSYNLFLDSNHMQVWGDPSPYHYGPVTPVSRATTTLTVYGLIPAGQDVSAGAYFDTVATTINF